jgi:hypothetical protein
MVSMKYTFIKWPVIILSVCGIHLYAYGAFYPLRARAGLSIEELGALAGNVLATDIKIKANKEEMVRVARTRGAPRVKKTRQGELAAELQTLETEMTELRKQFGAQIKDAIFGTEPPQHNGGSFHLPGKNGAFDCLSSDQGSTGSCTQENENLTFRW